MSQGNDFANYSAASNATADGSDEVWFVAVASDDIKQMTIDQLDEAFRLGVITGDTPVWTEGMEAWSPLAQVADLDSDANANEPSYEASGSHPKVEKEDASRQPAANQSGGMGSFGAASSAGAGFGAVTMQSMQHSFAPGPSSVAPVTASYAPSAQLGQSSVPVAIGDDEDLPPAKRGGFRPARWVLAGAAAVIAVGVIAYNNLSSSVASAGTEAATPAPALAARPYDGADGAERGAAPSSAARPAAPSAADEPAAASSGSAAVASAAAAASTTAKAALVASPASNSSADDEEPPASAKRGADKESLRNTFSKSLTKKASAKPAKVKPRKAASRATKSRATKATKKSTVVRSQSAFDPLNDSLP